MMGLSALGYIAQRLEGGRRGLLGRKRAEAGNDTGGGRLCKQLHL
jgi:hypothetical protein